MKNALLICISFLTLSCGAQNQGFKNISERNGMVGIGTQTPDELLTVKGTIHSQEVRVDLEGAVAPDYVFEHYFEAKAPSMPSYQLFPLSELEAYLKKEKHLPKVPSAAEMKDSGIALKEMNLLLLEKIEELTLYTLQQQKAIESLEVEVQKLQRNSN